LIITRRYGLFAFFAVLILTAAGMICYLINTQKHFTAIQQIYIAPYSFDKHPYGETFVSHQNGLYKVQ